MEPKWDIYDAMDVNINAPFKYLYSGYRQKTDIPFHFHKLDIRDPAPKSLSTNLMQRAPKASAGLKSVSTTQALVPRPEAPPRPLLESFDDIGLSPDRPFSGRLLDMHTEKLSPHREISHRSRWTKSPELSAPASRLVPQRFSSIANGTHFTDAIPGLSSTFNLGPALLSKAPMAGMVLDYGSTDEEDFDDSTIVSRSPLKENVDDGETNVLPKPPANKRKSSSVASNNAPSRGRKRKVPEGEEAAAVPGL